MRTADAVDLMVARAHLADAHASVADLRREVVRLNEVVRRMAGDFDAREKRLLDETASLREQLRLAQEQVALTNDKMAERERQARWEVAEHALDFKDKGGSEVARAYLREVRDANAPKD